VRIVRSKHPLPPGAAPFPGLLHCADLRIKPRGRLRFKLLVFSNSTTMKCWWFKAMGRRLGHGCRGAVNQLMIEHGDSVEVDPRYFCAVALCRYSLTMGIITHEACHIGFAYAARVAGTPWNCDRDNPEERVCYPAGEAGKAIVNELRRVGLLS
jgi:hypothetical protein